MFFYEGDASRKDEVGIIPAGDHLLIDLIAGLVPWVGSVVIVDNSVIKAFCQGSFKPNMDVSTCYLL